MVSTPPVAPGETYHLTIEDKGSQGDGIAYLRGFVIFVPNTEPGDAVSVIIEERRESYAVASVVGPTD